MTQTSAQSLARPVRAFQWRTTGDARAAALGLAPAVITAGAMTFWHWRMAGSVGLAAIGLYVLLALQFTGYGRLFTALFCRRFEAALALPTQFLIGFFVFNTLLFILILATPIGMLACSATLVAVCAVGNLLVVPFGEATEGRSHFPGLLSMVVCAVAATAWVSDSQAPIPIDGATAIFQTWKDTFIHVRVISEFAHSHGAASIQDIRFAGGAAPIYHFGSYMAPALATLVARVSAWQAYSSMQLPLGIFISGLGAFALMNSLLGRWPGLAGAAALVLLPDGFLQGFGNRYMSYQFLSQVNLGMLYGVACAALAWMFMVEGCRKGKYGQVALAYLFLAICLVYKAHLFVANAYLLLMFPWIFFARIRWPLRAIFAVLATCLFVAVLRLAQATGKVPLLQLDFSGVGSYIVGVLGNFDEGALHQFFTRVFIRETHSKPVQELFAIALLLLTTFGIWNLGFLLALLRGFRRLPLIVLAVPVLVLANYLIMATGLALDDRGIGTPDEMLNRPLVWAYFVVAAWTAGAAYYLTIGDRLPHSALGRGIAMVVAAIACASPFLLHRNLQTFPARDMPTYASFNAAPVCLVRAAEFVKAQSEPSEIIQDSGGDKRFLVTALAERQLYVGTGSFGPMSQAVKTRVAQLEGLFAMRDAPQIDQFARNTGLRWIVLRPDAQVSWPAAISASPHFECDGYRVYRLAQREAAY